MLLYLPYLNFVSLVLIIPYIFNINLFNSLIYTIIILHFHKIGSPNFYLLISIISRIKPKYDNILKILIIIFQNRTERLYYEININICRINHNYGDFIWYKSHILLWAMFINFGFQVHQWGCIFLSMSIFGLPF